MTPTIRVDDEVYALLQSEAMPFVDTPNTVLRRKLGLEAIVMSTAATAPENHGGLYPLIERGVLAQHQQLRWERRQHGASYTAIVTAGGDLLLEDGTRHKTPSSAARHLAGYEVNGWRVWKTESGKTLDELR